MSGWEDLDEWGMQCAEQLVKDVRHDAVEVFMDSVTTRASGKGDIGKTPVDRGKLMANTHLTAGSPSDRSMDKIDKSGASTKTAAMTTLQTAPAFERVYIQNNARGKSGHNYSLKADVYGWAVTPAYKFFTQSYIRMLDSLD